MVIVILHSKPKRDGDGLIDIDDDFYKNRKTLGCAVSYGDGTYGVWIDSSLSSAEDAFVLEHELEHIRMWENGKIHSERDCNIAAAKALVTDPKYTRRFSPEKIAEVLRKFGMSEYISSIPHKSTKKRPLYYGNNIDFNLNPDIYKKHKNGLCG